MFKKHLFEWCGSFIGTDELDEWYRTMTSHPDLHHFKNGITAVLQWTGHECKEMEKVLLAVLAGAGDAKAAPEVVKAAHAMLEFIYYVRHPSVSPLHEPDLLTGPIPRSYF